MTKNETYRLCGGTFFTLVSHARKEKPTKEEFYNGVKSGITEPEALWSLARILIPDISLLTESELQSGKDAARRFKSCASKSGGFFRLDDPAVIRSFDDRVKSRYSDPLYWMCLFVDDFLDIKTSTRKDEYLVKGLVELLSADSEIEDGAEFYVCKDGSTMTKGEILSADSICLQPFLLGLWHYVLTVVEDNRIGKSTYDEFCPQRGGAERTYTKLLGEYSKRNIKLLYADIPHYDEPETSEDITEDVDDVLVGDDVIEDVPPQAQQVQQTVDHPFIFNFTQHGNNNTQIAHIENYYADKKEKPDE